jgi:transposase
MQCVYLGVDVALDTLDVALATCATVCTEVGRFANEPAGWEGLVARLRQTVFASPDTEWHLVIEPTGGYEAGVQAFAYAQGWQVTLVNPLQLRRWAAGQGIRAKTDRQDARLLAS